MVASIQDRLPHNYFDVEVYFLSTRLSVISKNLFHVVPSRETSPISNHLPISSNLIVNRIRPARESRNPQTKFLSPTEMSASTESPVARQAIMRNRFASLSYQTVAKAL